MQFWCKLFPRDTHMAEIKCNGFLLFHVGQSTISVIVLHQQHRLHKWTRYLQLQEVDNSDWHVMLYRHILGKTLFRFHFNIPCLLLIKMILSHSHRQNLFIEDDSERILCTLSVGLYGKGYSSIQPRWQISNSDFSPRDSPICKCNFRRRRYIYHPLQYLHFN